MHSKSKLLTIVLAGTLSISAWPSERSAWREQAPTAPLPAGSQAKRMLKAEDCAVWEALAGTAISPDGRWFCYGISLVDGDGRLAVRSCDGPERAEIVLGSGGRFSDDSKWLGYSIGVPKKEAEKLREQKKPVENAFGLRNLATGSQQRWESVQSWAFTKGGRFVILQRYRPAPRAAGGHDVLILDLATDSTLGVSSVAEWSVRKDGRLLALRFESDGPERGIQVLDLHTRALRNVHWGKSTYSNMVWAESGSVLGFLFGSSDPKKEGDWNSLCVVSGLDAESPTLKVYDPSKDEKFPKGMRIAEFGGLGISDDGSSLSFGIKTWEEKKAPAGKPEDKPNVDVWHYKDIDPQPLQARSGPQKRSETLLCVWRPSENRFIQVGTERQPLARLLDGHRHALVEDPKPHETAVKVGGLEHSDWWIVDVLEGTRSKVAERRRFPMIPSPDGGYLAYYWQKNWWIYDIAKGRAANVTEDLRQSFEDPDNDLTLAEKPPADGPDWLAGDAGMVVYTKFDAYLVTFSSMAATRLIERGKEQIVFRLRDVGFHEDGIRLQDPWYFSAFDEGSKASGFYRREPDGKGRMSVIDPSMLTGLRRAKDVDRLTFVQQTFEKSPTVLLTNEQFAAIKPLASTNPQQSGFFWGKTELVEYKSKTGAALQGILIYPADYVPNRQYPMVTYIYERLSRGLHQYRMPVDWQSYNQQMLSQRGYFVLMPDIVYRDRNPGISAVECLEPAVAAVLKKGIGVDSKRVGLVGHSWGAYQTAFVVTQSKVFSAAVAGAPLTELMSMYNSFYWNWGETNQVIFESSQGRMAVPWWEDMKSYLDNSPVFHAGKITAPLLIAFGDADGAVDWHQGQYLYNTMRRMGKSIIMLVYPGENHGLAKRPNQLDYAKRVRHFFDVHLQGAKPEPWVTQGVPFVKKGEG